MIFNNISFSFFGTKRQPVRGKSNDCFQTLSSFLPIILVPEYAEDGLVALTIITNGKKYPNSLYIGGKLLILLKTFRLWSSKSAATKVIWFWLAVFSEIYAIITKNDIVKSNKSSSFRWQFQCSATFVSSTLRKIRTVDLVGIANFIIEILQVVRFCWAIFVQHRAFSRH